MNKWFESAMVFATLAGFFIIASGFINTPLAIFGINSLLLGSIFVPVALVSCALGFMEEWYKEWYKSNKSFKKFLELILFLILFLIPYLFLLIINYHK
jgi:hypothetical protein